MLAKPIKVVPTVSVLAEQFKVEDICHTCEHEPFHQGLAQEPHYPRMGREADHGFAGPARRFVVEASSFVSQEQGSHSRRDP